MLQGRSSATFAARQGWVRGDAAAFLWFLAFALLTRFSVFGDVNYTNDEMFYVLVGQRAHEGLLPYVDIWDRKGPGLFLVYYLIAAFSWSVLAYQIAAWLAAAATAGVVFLIAGRVADRRGALFAGTFYLALLPLYGGGGGQSPVFYNLPMALAALLVVRTRDDLRQGRAGMRVHLAMALAGFAITFKQTAVVEAVFLGCYCLWQLRAGELRPLGLVLRAVPLALAGAAPMLAFGLAMAAAGHFAEFWQAMVGSNLSRTYFPSNDTAARAAQFALLCSPAILLGVAGVLSGDRRAPWAGAFLGGWLLAAAGGVAIVPNFFEHYALPFMLPASVAASCVFLGQRIKPLYAYAFVAVILAMGPAFHFGDRQRSREAMASLVEGIKRRDPHPRLLVYEGPVYLYRRLESFPPSPLQYPMHLFFPYEDNASQFDTAAEMRRILAWRPTVVVMYRDFPAAQENPRTSPMLRSYVARHCREWFTGRAIQAFRENELVVYGDCRP